LSKLDTIDKLRKKVDRILCRATENGNEVRIEGDDIAGVTFGKEVSTPFGPCYIMDYEYDLGAFHGHKRIREVFDYGTWGLSEILKEPDLGNLDPEQGLYLDIETTGLSAAEGAFPFMIGVGYFEKKVFKVVQFFARDYEEEPATLNLLMELVKKKSHLITFNGRSFDVPMLDARLRAAKFDARLGNLPHIDLLVPARRLWKYCDHGCSLGALENSRLGFVRHGDVPGYEIPPLYNQYTRSRDLRKLVVVFTHNVYDVISMVVLQARICQVLQMDQVHELSPEETFALGRVHNSFGRYDIAYRLFADSVKGLSSGQRYIAYKEMAGILRKRKDLKEAAKIYKAMIKDKPEKLFPYMKLAVHLENREKDFVGAIKIIDAGFKYVVFGSWEKKKKWEYRKTRIIGKLEKSLNQE